MDRFRRGIEDGKTALKKKDFKGAFDYFDTSYRQDPGSFEAMDLLCTAAHGHASFLANDMGDPVVACEYARKIVELVEKSLKDNPNIKKDSELHKALLSHKSKAAQLLSEQYDMLSKRYKKIAEAATKEYSMIK